MTAEGVLSANPTLVIGDTQSAPLAAIEQIRAAGVPVVILPIATSFDEMYEKVASLGELLDCVLSGGGADRQNRRRRGLGHRRHP